MTGAAPTMFITPGQMQGLGRLVSEARLTEPDHELGEPLAGRWMIQLDGDGDLVVHDAERIIHVSPGGGTK